MEAISYRHSRIFLSKFSKKEKYQESHQGVKRFPINIYPQKSRVNIFENDVLLFKIKKESCT